MKRIGLLSDTHSHIHSGAFPFFMDCEEIWHAGDIGDMHTASQLSSFKPLRAVYGNIDGPDVRHIYPEVNIFVIENIKIAMMHIGGYPGRYDKKARAVIEKEKPGLFISGHSHILKVIFDHQYKMLHINPGAAGKFGMHRVVTCVRFILNDTEVKDLEIFEAKRE